MRLGLRLGHTTQSLLGSGAMKAITRALHMPEWHADTPHPASGGIPRTQLAGATAIYFPSCISRVMGRLPGEPQDSSLMEVFVEVARRAGKPIHIPRDVAGNCCGTPFSSKGFVQAHAVAVNGTIERMWNGAIAASCPSWWNRPCTYGLLTSRQALTPENQEKFDRLRVLDSIDFVHDELLPSLTIRHKADSVVLHPVCSVTKLDLTPKLVAIARACSAMAIVPPSTGCCGFAGDRGFLVPSSRHPPLGVRLPKQSRSRTMDIFPAAAPARSA